VFLFDFMLRKERTIFFDFSFSNTISVAIANERKKELEVQISVSSEKFYGTKFIADVVNSALKISGVRFDDINKIVLARGPGSFTALRALIAYAQGISFALKIPIYTTLTFRWIALFLVKFLEKETIKFHLFSGKKNIFYCAEYEFDVGEKKEEIKIKKEKERIFLCGGENLISSLDIERVVPAELGAKYLAELFFTQPNLFDFFSPDEIHKIKPEYLMETDFKRFV
jgi:tRNA A37 threonylcarbamoyladenosine modification protein TsaB